MGFNSGFKGLRNVMCSLTCCLFMLQWWSLVLREGQRSRVFNSSAVRMLGHNVNEVMGRLVKLHDWFVASVNRMVCFDQTMTLQHWKVRWKRDKNWSWREKKEYLVDLGVGRIVLNALVHCTVSSDLPRSSRYTSEFLMFQHHKWIRSLHRLIRMSLYGKIFIN